MDVLILVGLGGLMFWPIWSARHDDSRNTPLGNMAIQFLVLIAIIGGIFLLAYILTSPGDSMWGSGGN